LFKIDLLKREAMVMKVFFTVEAEKYFKLHPERLAEVFHMGSRRWRSSKFP
jgi:hypothetical protein